MSTAKNSWTSIPGPDDIHRVELKNGVVVLARENFSSPSVVINGYLGGGSMNDPEDKLGLALFTSQALMRGTQEHTQQEIFERLESAGASLGFSVGVHTATFGGRALAEDLGLLLETLEECVRRPVFPQDEMARLRAQLLTSLAIRDQDTEQQASLTFEKLVFKGHPYGRPEDGTTETMGLITAADAADFHRKYYSPRGLVIVVVGALSVRQAVDAVEKVFGDWESSEPPEMPVFPDFQRITTIVRQHIPMQDKYQVDLELGTLGPSRKSDEYMPLSLGNHILGQFGMMGRIGESVRERAGLAYYAGSSVNSGLLGGSWAVTAGVNPENVEKAIDLIRQELKRFVEKPVTSDEISDSVSNLVGQLPLSLESNAGVASALVRMERFDLGLDYFRRYPDLLRAIQPTDILQAARRWLNVEHLVIASAGPQLKGMGG